MPFLFCPSLLQPACLDHAPKRLFFHTSHSVFLRPLTCFIRYCLCFSPSYHIFTCSAVPFPHHLSLLFLFLVSFLRHPALMLVLLIFVSSLIAQPSLPGHLPCLAPPVSPVTSCSSVPVRPGMHGHCGCQATCTSDWPCHPWQVRALPGQTFPSTSQ